MPFVSDLQRLMRFGRGDTTAPFPAVPYDRPGIVNDLVWIAVVAAAYFGGAQIGFALTFATKQVTAAWPPAGIAVAALLLRGQRAWPGVFIGAFVSNAASDEPLVTAAMIAAGNTIGSMAAAFLLRRFVRITVGLTRLRDVLGLALLGSLAMTITATNGVASLALGGIVPWSAYPEVWWVWWVGDSMGVLLIAPAILAWHGGVRLAWSGARLIELAVVMTAVVVTAVAFFSTQLPLAYPIFPVVVWIALRFEQRETATALLVVSCIAVWQTVHDNGPFVAGSLDERLVALVTFLAVLAVTALALGALAAERRRAESSLRTANDWLEAGVASRTALLAAANSELTSANAQLEQRTAELALKNEEVLLDNMERRLSEERLRQSEERFRGAFETAAHGMALVSTEGRWLKVNKALCGIIGYSEQELLVTDFQTITHPDDLDADLGHVQQLLAGEIETYQMEKRYFHKRGHIIWVLLSVSLVRDARGRPVHFVSQILDITAARRAEGELRQAKEEAERANVMKSAFLAMMSHEIRTPLNGVLGLADILLRSNLSDEQRQSATLLRDSGRSLLALVNDILDLSKIEAGKLQLESRPLRLSDLIGGAVSVVGAQADAKKLKLTTQCGRGLPEWVDGDATRLRQVLLNLLSNAIKFTEQGGVTLRLRRADGATPALLFEVEDTGPGIAPENLHVLFREFSQVDRSITRRYGGTGLGLAICKRLIEAMPGGRIDVDSELGRGSRFWFQVALAPVAAPPGAVEKTGPRAPTPAAAPARILVAEDNTVNQMVVKHMLTRAGHEVVIVGNGRAAVQAVQAEAFDLVLMDMEMPEMDGISAARAIRQLAGPARAIPIVALTANAMAVEIARCMDAGMSEHLSKPIDRELLLETVARWTSMPGSEPIASPPQRVA
jgi:PAS domain S-box-containing protein